MPGSGDSKRDPRKAVPAPAAYIRALLRRFGTTPALRTALLEGTDFDDKTLADPGAEVTLYSFVTFSENLTRVIGEEWPIDTLPAWSTAMQGALEVAVRSAPTAGEGFETMTRYGHVRGPYLALAFKRGKAASRMTLASTIAMSDATRRAMIETAILSAAAMILQVLEDAAGALEFHVSWPPPRYAARFASHLPGELKFNQREVALVVPNELCDRPSPFADPALHASAVAELEHAARRIRADRPRARRGRSSPASPCSSFASSACLSASASAVLARTKLRHSSVSRAERWCAAWRPAAPRIGRCSTPT